MKGLVNILGLAILTMGLPLSLQAQCSTWNDSPQKDEAEAAHSLYRDVVRGKQPADLAAMSEENFKHGFDNWKKAYDIAPAADGQRAMHFSDGRIFYKALIQKETDEAKKAELYKTMFAFYDQQIECYENEAYLTGRKAFDMFYAPVHGYRPSTLDAMKKAVELGGNDTEYIVFDPYSKLVVYFFQKEKMTKDEAREVYLKLEEIGNHNVENNERYGAYYKQAMDIMKSEFKKIENDIFDCQYFKDKLLPEYQEKKADLETVKYIYNKLINQGCSDDDPELQDIKTQYESLATEINAKLEEERRQNNPGYDAIQLQKEKKYPEAVARYEEAIKVTEDAEALAQYHYSVAFIKTWQLRQYGSARQHIQDAAKHKEGWGKPYILLGDIYAKMSTGCKEDWDKRLAILAAMQKYNYAKSIDPEVASDANKRIGQYRGALPAKEEGFMRKVSEGDRVTCGCGIGEQVTIRFKS